MTPALHRAPLLLLLAACSESPDFDGLYRVERHTLATGSCDAPGDALETAYPMFEIRARDFAGVTVYPVHPCDERGACDDDNDGRWALVVVEGDLDQVSSTYAASGDDACVLGSQDLVIAAGEAEGVVVLQARTLEVVIEPYDPDTCTTANARRNRGRMECVALEELVGTLVQ